MIQTKHFQYYLIIAGILLFLPTLGASHLFDWDEINFAESAREMIVTGDYSKVMVNYEPFWEKPPLFFWLQAVSMSIFGVNEFAARLPNAIIGIVTLLIIYRIGKTEVGGSTARLWALLYLGSITPNLYFHSGIIDPLFNLLIFLSFYQLFRAYKSNTLNKWVLSGVFLGLAVLTKGPVAGVIVLLTLIVVVIRNGFKLWYKWYEFVLFGFVSLSVASIWFLPELIRNGSGFLVNFLAYQVDLFRNPVASHGQPWFYHPVVLLIGCFPAAILAIPSFRIQYVNGSLAQWAKYLFWVVLILFSIVTTKIVHYSSMCYFPLTLMAADVLNHRLQRDKRKFPWMVAVIAFLWVLIFVALPIVGLKRIELIETYGHLIQDDFTLGNIGARVNWSILNVVIGCFSMPVLALLVVGLWQNNRLITCWALVGLAGYLTVFGLFNLNKVEGHTQGEVIGFYKSISDEDCYVDVYRFKSYAHYFYMQIEPLDENDRLVEIRQESLHQLGVNTRIELDETGRKQYNSDEMDFYLTGDIDKPVYLIAQPRKAPELRKLEAFEEVWSGGGYYAFKRQPGPSIIDN